MASAMGHILSPLCGLQFLPPLRGLEGILLEYSTHRSRSGLRPFARYAGYVKGRELNPIMPWVDYRGMSHDDAAAAFAYLQALKPVHHRVDNSEPATPCRLCQASHGGGNTN